MTIKSANELKEYTKFTRYKTNDRGFRDIIKAEAKEKLKELGCGKWLNTSIITLEYEYLSFKFCGQKQQYEEIIILEYCPKCQEEKEIYEEILK